jgi:hypothetical protein
MIHSAISVFLMPARCLIYSSGFYRKPRGHHAMFYPETRISEQIVTPRQSPVPNNAKKQVGKFYRPRDHATSPFFKVVRDHFDEFERVYPEKFQTKYGYWRPIIRTSHLEVFTYTGEFWPV